jgi:hypothetical protein
MEELHKLYPLSVRMAIMASKLRTMRWTRHREYMEGDRVSAYHILDGNIEGGYLRI